MAYINHTISLGIGAPADIGFFIRFGLATDAAIGTIPVTLLERYLLTATLPEREILFADLYDRLNTLQERSILDSQLHDRDISARLTELRLSLQLVDRSIADTTLPEGGIKSLSPRDDKTLPEDRKDKSLHERDINTRTPSRGNQ